MLGLHLFHHWYCFVCEVDFHAIPLKEHLRLFDNEETSCFTSAAFRNNSPGKSCSQDHSFQVTLLTYGCTVSCSLFIRRYLRRLRHIAVIYEEKTELLYNSGAWTGVQFVWSILCANNLVQLKHHYWFNSVGVSCKRLASRGTLCCTYISSFQCWCKNNHHWLQDGGWFSTS